MKQINEFEPYLKQIKEGKLLELKRNKKKEYDFKLLVERTNLSFEEVNDLLTLAVDEPELAKKLLSYAKV